MMTSWGLPLNAAVSGLFGSSTLTEISAVVPVELEEAADHGVELGPRAHLVVGTELRRGRLDREAGAAGHGAGGAGNSVVNRAGKSAWLMLPALVVSSFVYHASASAPNSARLTF